MAVRKRQQISKQFFDRIHPIESNVWQEVVEILEFKALKRGEVLTRTGDVFQFEGLILEGIVRSLYVDEKGDDYTLDFYKEGQMLSPYFSRTYEQKSFIGLEALDFTVVALFNTEKFTALRYKYPSLLRFGNKVTEAELFRKTGKEIRMATLTARQRYAKFQEDYGTLENRIPQVIVASYLGVSPVSLSRLRGTIAHDQ